MRPLPMRADKALRDALGWPRRAIDEAVRAGRVSLDTPHGRERVGFSDCLVFPGDQLSVDDRAIPEGPPRGAGAGRVFALNKPAGVVTTRSDPSGRPCVGAWTDQLGEGFFPVGRLDAETTGLLLLTEDGDLAHVLLHPRHHIAKTYLLRVRGVVANDDPRLVALREGLTLDDGPARALEACAVGSGPLLERPGGPSEATTSLLVVIDEGRHRIVRRMAGAVRFDLLALHRSRIGSLELGALAPGALRELTPAEVSALWGPFGGVEALRAAQLDALRRLLARWEAASTHAPDEARSRRRDRLAAWLTGS
jgi:23S rRNA pseudouridine2605 synthase